MFYKGEKTIALLRSPASGWNVIVFERSGLDIKYLAQQIPKQRAVRVAKAYMELN